MDILEELNAQVTKPSTTPGRVWIEHDHTRKFLSRPKVGIDFLAGELGESNLLVRTRSIKKLSHHLRPSIDLNLMQVIQQTKLPFRCLIGDSATWHWVIEVRDEMIHVAEPSGDYWVFVESIDSIVFGPVDNQKPDF